MMGKTVLISIHPEHVANILDGRKIFEYRKVIPSQDISYLVLYSTAPVMKIVAVAEVLDCIVGSPTQVWNATAFGSGITRQVFRKYFSGKRSAKAFSIGTVHKLSNPLELSALAGMKAPPQSFSYLSDDDMGLIFEKCSSVPAVPSYMVFVGGIHGVGKSTICKEKLDLVGYKHVTASSLIAQHGRETDSSKRVYCVGQNQSILLQAIEKAKLTHNRLLIDGHFTLINRQGKVEPIDVDIFRAMMPNQLILIKGKPNEIAERLQSRDKKYWTKSFISKFQEIEEAHARYVSKNIGVPLRIIRNDVVRISRNIKPRLLKTMQQKEEGAMTETIFTDVNYDLEMLGEHQQVFAWKNTKVQN